MRNGSQVYPRRSQKRCFTDWQVQTHSVPRGGLEPPRGCPQRFLRPSRLPIPPPRLALVWYPRTRKKSSAQKAQCPRRSKWSNCHTRNFGNFGNSCQQNHSTPGLKNRQRIPPLEPSSTPWARSGKCHRLYPRTPTGSPTANLPTARNFSKRCCTSCSGLSRERSSRCFRIAPLRFLAAAE